MSPWSTQLLGWYISTGRLPCTGSVQGQAGGGGGAVDARSGGCRSAGFGSAHCCCSLSPPALAVAIAVLRGLTAAALWPLRAAVQWGLKAAALRQLRAAALWAPQYALLRPAVQGRGQSQFQNPKQ